MTSFTTLYYCFYNILFSLTSTFIFTDVLELIPTQDLYRALQWIVTGQDPMQANNNDTNPEMKENGDNNNESNETKESKDIETNANNESKNETEHKEGKEEVVVLEEKRVEENKDTYGMHVTEMPKTTLVHDRMIDGVIDDVDHLMSSIEYWTSLIQAPGGNVVRARTRAYNRQHRKKEEKSDWRDTTTSEDIDEMLHWRETSCGIDDATLAALLIGRGGAMRVSIFHPKLMNDNTFGNM